MDDESPDWFTSDEPAAPAADAPAAAAAGDDAAPAAEGGEAPGEGGAEDEKREEAAEEEYLDPNKLLLFKHWIRPKFFQYQYLYDYRRNYYDDVLEVLDRRRKGYRTKIPRPQTWAERIIRSHRDPIYKVESFDKFLGDIKFVTKSEISGSLQSYYVKESINKRYSKLLY